MAMPALQSEPCECPPGCCASLFGEDDCGHCVNRYDEVCQVTRCVLCKSYTWHHGAFCLRCKERLQENIDEELMRLRAGSEDLL